MTISTISSTGKGSSKVVKDTLAIMGHDGTKQQQPSSKDDKQVQEVQSIKQVGEQVATSTYSRPPILRYVPKSRHKEGESPFTGVANEDTEGKVIRKANEASITTLKQNAMVPTFKAWQMKLSRPPLIGFVVFSSGSDNLPNARFKEGFDPNAYKVM